MVLDEKEFDLFCKEIVDVAIKEGVGFEKITTILAKSIKNREDEITKQQRNQVSQKPQMVYGPPQRKETNGVVQKPQMVYGPPQRKETFEVVQKPQMVYGPPPRKTR